MKCNPSPETIAVSKRKMGYSQNVLLSSSPAIFFVGQLLKKLHITKVVYNFSYMCLPPFAHANGENSHSRAFAAYDRQKKTGPNRFRDSRTVDWKG
jgi:hypothetical protein